MKTINLILALFLISQLANAQYNSLPLKKTNSTNRNSLSLEYASQFASSIRFDRKLYQKRNYALVAQAGLGLQIIRPNYLQKRHLTLALYNQLTFGDHNIEAGAGVVHTKRKWAPDILRFPELDQWEREAYIHLAYSLRPQNKNWFLKLSYDPILKKDAEPEPNFSIGGGFSF